MIISLACIIRHIWLQNDDIVFVSHVWLQDDTLKEQMKSFLLSTASQQEIASLDNKVMLPSGAHVCLIKKQPMHVTVSRSTVMTITLAKFVILG